MGQGQPEAQGPGLQEPCEREMGFVKSLVYRKTPKLSDTAIFNGENDGNGLELGTSRSILGTVYVE